MPTSSAWVILANAVSNSGSDVAGIAGGGAGLRGRGEHVVDDAAVETPGTCHLETWATQSSGSDGLVDGAAACTREAGRIWSWEGSLHTAGAMERMIR